MADKKVKFRLKGHASFVLREGWINKGIRAVYEDNNLFREKRSADVLGVGNNMVQSIRYWLKACNIIKEVPTIGAELTEFGDLIRQYDPCLEELFTIWILHCNLACNKDLATTWYLFFNCCEVEELTRDEIFNQLQFEMKKYTNEAEYSVPSIRDDVMVLTHMYLKNRKKDYEPEDNNVCPLSLLELLSENRDKYSKEQPNLSKLDRRVVYYQILAQMQNNSISIDSLMDNENSVGKILNINRVSLNRYLDALASDGLITVTRTAGLDMIYKSNDMKPIDVLYNFYHNITN